MIVGLEYSYGLARLDQQGLVVVEILQGSDDRAIRFPTSSGAACSAVDDEVFRTLGYLFV